MKVTKRNALGIGCLGVLLLMGGLLAFYPLWHHHHCIGITREWARLAPFPESARNVHVEVTGNMFTRGFEVSFTAPKADIEAWLRASPGPSSVLPESPSPGTLVYFIQPGGGGAMYGEVTVNKAAGWVKIRVAWS